MFKDNTQQEAHHKLILLYLIDRFGIPLTNEQIIQVIMEKDYMNYFMLQQFLSDLTSSGMIEYSQSQDKYFYLITEKGKNALGYFKNHLSKSLLDALDRAIQENKKMLSKEMEVCADYRKKADSEYIVELKVIENDTKLIELKLNVVNNKQAKTICQKWKDDAPKLYSEIIHLLIEEE